MPQNYTDSARGVLRSVNGQDYTFAPSYLRSRDPITPATSPDIKPKEQQGHYPVSSFWTNTTNQNVWVLAGIINNLGKWVLITSGGSGPLITLTGDDAVTVSPTVTGNINLLGLVVANATHTKAVFTESPSANTEKIDIQVSAAIAASNIANVGLAAFNNTEFTVDANGFVSLVGGGSAIEKIMVDTFTAPGTNPVVPNSGLITVTGGQVAAGAVGTNVIQTDSLAANTYTIQIQRSQAVSTSTVADNGVSHFDSAHFLVDTNGFVTTTAFNQLGVANLGITQSAGTTFTVTSANGTALSSSNPGYVTLQSLANPGQLKTYTITANQSFTQSQLGNNLFGVTSGVNITVDVPFYLYAVSNANNGENTISFMISRIPILTVAPVAGKIGQSGNTNASTQGSLYSLPAITAADYASSPCLLIGSFRMRYASSLWTIQSINQGDGVGEYNDGSVYNMPLGQFGTATSSQFYANGGTAPIFSTNNTIYTISKNGLLTYSTAPINCTTGGAGAVTLIMGLPFQVGGGGVGSFWIFDATNNITYAGTSVQVSGPSNQIRFFVNANPGNGVIQNAAITQNASTTGQFFTSAYVQNI